MTIDEALASVKAGGSLKDLPLALRTEAVCLAAVQHNGSELLYAPKQTFEMCVAAAKQDENALCYVDLEFRTDALLRAAGYAEEYFIDDNSDETYTYADESPSGNETTYVTFHGKGNPVFMTAARNMVRRLVETSCNAGGVNTPSFSLSIWSGEYSAEEAGCSEMTIASDNSSFTMSFFWDGDKDIDWVKLVFANLYTDADPDFAPELVLVTGIDRAYEQVRSCGVFYKSDNSFEYEICRDWSFSVGDGEDELYESRDLFDALVEKRLKLWFADSSGDVAAIKQAEKEFEEAEEALDSFGDEDSDDDEDWDDEEGETLYE